MGLLVDLYRDVDGVDCTNRGVSSRNIKGFCVTNIEAPFEPSSEYPAAKLVKNEYTHGNTATIVPEEVEDEWTMFGGNYAACSDSRFSRAVGEIFGTFSFHGAIPIHDRVEAN